MKRRPKFPFTLNRNQYFIGGLLIGLLVSIILPQNAQDIMQEECYDSMPDSATGGMHHYRSEDFEPKLNLANKPLAAKKPSKSIIRPRYYSSELGIREKLFVGVLSSKDNIKTFATAFNKTTAHLVNRIKFFINADNVKTNYVLKNIVGFTDTRINLRPFHVLKYIADNYLDDFDYFLLVPDTAYVDARELKKLVSQISITFDVYMGRPLEPLYSNSNDQEEQGYCDLSAGIILSSSVIRKIRTNLDWCVRNAATSSHSLTIGKCVKYSTKINGCQRSFQEINFISHKLHTYKLYHDLKFLKEDQSFNSANIVYPVSSSDDFYILHTYFSRLHLEQLKLIGKQMERNAHAISNGSVSPDIMEVRWPIGVSEASAPETRHDLIPWQYVNGTHALLGIEKNSIQFSSVDIRDFNRILERTILYANKKYPNLKYVNVETAYRRFDPNRGMDYHLHLNFIDNINRQNQQMKSFEVVKPLGGVEIVPSPYVTESTRVALLLPTFEHQVKESIEFVNLYEKICMENHDNTFLMLVFMYRMDSASKGNDDPFYQLKVNAMALSEKFKSDGSRIAWVSIRLPAFYSQPVQLSNYRLNTIYGHNEILSLAIVDLTLPKFGVDSLILIVSNSMNFRADFINRVRMNTIQGVQIYSPIGFQMYPCSLANLCSKCETCDVGQSTGYFDRYSYDVISFYGGDYVDARKMLQNQVPIVRSDLDIDGLALRSGKHINNIVDMFVESKLNIHIFRAIEPNVRLGFSFQNFIDYHHEVPKCPFLTGEEHNNVDDERVKKCLHVASRKQIGDAIVRYRDSLETR